MADSHGTSGVHAGAPRPDPVLDALAQALSADLLPHSEVEMVLGVQRSILGRLKASHASLAEQNDALEGVIARLRAARSSRAELREIRQCLDAAHAALR